MSYNKNNNQDVVFKMVIITLLALFIFGFFYNTLGGRSGIFFSLYYGQGIELSNLITSMLVIAVKILWFIFIISLIIGLAFVVKKYLTDKKRINPNLTGIALGAGYTCPCCGTRLTAEFKFCPACKASLKEICKKCGKELQVGWKCCPLCGEEKSNK